MAKELLKPVTVSNAKPGDKDKRLNDGNGLYVLIKTTGAKWWRLDYTINGTRKTLSLGVFPATSLADARRKAEEARAKVANGVDPSDTRKEIKAAKQIEAENQKRIDAGLPAINSFEHVAREWLASLLHTVTDKTHQKKVRRFELHVFPSIGQMGIAVIKSPNIYSLLKPLIAKGELETAHRLHSEIGAAFAYAIAHGFTDYDPAQAVAAQIPPQKVKHRAALTEQKEVGQMLRDIYSYEGTFVVQCALRISPLLFQRPGEIRQMEWKDVDLVEREWRPFVTKTNVLHIVPLSAQAITILEAIKPLTGSGRYVFPSIRGDGRPMSDGTIRTALRTLGYDKDSMSAHGFRTTASTLLNEQGWSPDAIERQLCHMPKDQVRAAYNRAQYLDERRRMMQAWADYLDGLKNGAQIIPIKKIG
ncbi:tyrosine-type recombinase/integrase [Methylomicrobium lacus]|uniref:tyrosine-type recombinase/integrase n=1 Tax=Methylomicrobium lacus TaxID=136992 RepID=UPI0035A93E21